MSPIPLASILDPRSSLASLAKRLPTSHSPSTIASPQQIPRSPHILSRQSNANIIPSTYGAINSGPSPGTVVGIVIGSVGGFLLVLWLIYTCLNFGSFNNSSSSYTESVVVRDRRKSHAGSQRSRRVSETVEVRRDRSPIRIVREEPARVERVIVEEERREVRRERERSRGSDEVVVIEEHSPPRRGKSKRDRRDEEKRDRSEDGRRESGFRTVDPLAYGGVVGGRKNRR